MTCSGSFFRDMFWMQPLSYCLQNGLACRVYPINFHIWVFGHTLLTQQTHQRWINVETTLIVYVHTSVSLFQRWYLVENESWADVCLSMLFQCWQNNIETALKELRQFNVDDPMLSQSWYFIENESCITVYSSAFLRRWENSIETTLWIAALIYTDVH